MLGKSKILWFGFGFLSGCILIVLVFFLLLSSIRSENSGIDSSSVCAIPLPKGEMLLYTYEGFQPLSGLKFVANGCPWSPPFASIISIYWSSSKWFFFAWAQNIFVTPGSKPHPKRAISPLSLKRSWYSHCHL